MHNGDTYFCTIDWCLHTLQRLAVRRWGVLSIRTINRLAKCTCCRESGATPKRVRHTLVTCTTTAVKNVNWLRHKLHEYQIFFDNKTNQFFFSCFNYSQSRWARSKLILRSFRWPLSVWFALQSTDSSRVSFGTHCVEMRKIEIRFIWFVVFKLLLFCRRWFVRYRCLQFDSKRCQVSRESSFKSFLTTEEMPNVQYSIFLGGHEAGQCKPSNPKERFPRQGKRISTRRENKQKSKNRKSCIIHLAWTWEEICVSEEALRARILEVFKVNSGGFFVCCCCCVTNDQIGTLCCCWCNRDVWYQYGFNETWSW